MTKYRKKPVVIDAIYFDGRSIKEVGEWCIFFEPVPARAYFLPVDEEDRIEDPDIIAEVYDKLHSTWVGVKAGQWIIHGIQGEFYPCDPDVFAETYEELEDD